MATEKTIKLPYDRVKKALGYLGMVYSPRSVQGGKQLKLTFLGYEHVSVTVFESTNSVLVQPHDAPEADFLRTVFKLRALKLRQDGEIE